MSTALILGISGQTGSYLCDVLLGKGYDVHGVIRRSSSFNTGRLDHVYDHPRLRLHYGDVLDPLSIRGILSRVEPHEVYNLAAQSHVKVSFDQPVYSVESVAMGALHVLEALRDYRDHGHPNVRFYQASSSEMFGDSPPPQNEHTPFRPRSPYACAKCYAYWQTVNYREAYGLHACNGVLFNHESERRGETFVTRKITRAVGRIFYGLQDKLVLGNLDARRDWGFAGDYAEAIWRIVQHPTPDDFVIATGISIAVRTWLEMAFTIVGLNWSDYVTTDERYMRPTEVPALCGDASKARKLLGWEPSVSLNRLCCQMMTHDLELAAVEADGKRFKRGFVMPLEVQARMQSPRARPMIRHSRRRKKSNK